MFRTAIHHKTFTAITTVVFLASAAPALAQGPQPWTDRGYFNVNVGFETTSGTLADSRSFVKDLETGTMLAEHNVDSGSLFDFSVGSRVWRNVSVGLGYHRGSNTSEGSATASVPHPLIFNSHRAAAAAASGLDRTESAIHLLIGYMIPVSDVLSVHVTAGPSFFRLKQDVIGDLTFTETAPFTTVDAAPQISERSDSAAGVNVGVDVTYQFWESDAYRIGAGAFLRYAGASARITVLENSVDSDVGGLQFGLGARVRV